MIRVTKLTLQGQVIECGAVNLILGSNNTGKSSFLREVLTGLDQTEILPTNQWVNGMDITITEVRDQLDSLFPSIFTAASFEKVADFGGGGLLNLYPGLDWNGNVFNEFKNADNDAKTISIGIAPQKHSQYYFYKFVTRLKTLSEFCDSRLSGPFETNIAEISGTYSDFIHFLYANELLFKKVSGHIKHVFGFEIVFDDLEQGRKQIRIKPLTKVNKSTLPKATYADYWKQNSKLVSAQGDGLKAYLKIIYGLFALDRDVILIDEPEAFLHPPQRRSLGKFISENANQGKQIFIATHDSEFLRGVLTSPVDSLKIIHLRNNSGNYSFNVSPADKTIKSQYFNELLLNSYFNKITVLCEAEDDRMIYQYTSERYLPDITVDVNFVGLNGKSAVIKNLLTLRARDLNAVCILDVDALYSNEIINAIIISDANDRQMLEQLKIRLLAVLVDKPLKKAFRTTGINHSSVVTFKSDICTVISMLQKYGIFVLENGELETWMKVKKSDGKKVQTIINEINRKTYSKLKSFIKKVLSFTA